MGQSNASSNFDDCNDRSMISQQLQGQMNSSFKGQNTSQQMIDFEQGTRQSKTQFDGRKWVDADRSANSSSQKDYLRETGNIKVNFGNDPVPD